MKQILGICGLLVVVCILTTLKDPRFLQPYNLENVLRRSAILSIAGIGVALVIITSGIDLSIGSVIALVGTVLPMLLVEYNWGVPAALLATLGISLLIGLTHGLLITRLKLQPFIVTLCGLLIYRGLARYLSGDQTQGFGTHYDGLRSLATGKPFSVPVPLANWISAGNWSRWQWDFTAGDYARNETGHPIPLDWLEWIAVPAPLLVMLVVAILAGMFLNYTIWGRYLFALGRNEQAARYSGIETNRLIVLAYVLCGLTSGIAGVLFALELGSVQPSAHGNFYELYAIAAAVLGGCSLRGGEGSVTGVVVGAAVMLVLKNAINVMGIRSELEFVIIGGVILAGVIADEVVKRLAARRRKNATLTE